MGTNEYLLGNGELAEQLGCKKSEYGNSILYKLPPANGNSWIIDIHPAPGLFVTNAFFQLLEPVTRTYAITQTGLWLCSWDSGDATIIEIGKKARKLCQGIHLVVNRGQMIKVIFSAAEPIWYTSVLLFDDFLTGYLKGRPLEEGFTSAAATAWKNPQYNTPDLVMVFEQIKYAIRDATVPMLYYEGKIGEILALIMRNIQHEAYYKTHFKKHRPEHLTYQNLQYILRVKSALDKDILNPPTIEALTAIAEMGATKLRQCFKILYKMTIAQYVRQEQMNYALRLLSHDNMSICNIAGIVGYDSASQFTVAFKKVHGFAPSEIRKSFRI